MSEYTESVCPLPVELMESEECGAYNERGERFRAVFNRVHTLERQLEGLVARVGDPSRCKACGADILWVTHRNGKKAPYTPAGLSHFADCPGAARFKKPEGARP